MPHNSGGGFVLGIGLSENAGLADAMALAEDVIARSGFQREQIGCIATLSSRSDHPILRHLASRLNTAVTTFDPIALEAETPRLANPSEALFARMGCHGVAEAAALAAAGKAARLIVAKVKAGRVTMAIAA
ncbi:MAG: Precorrin-3B methylase [Rhizobium sp.]|nr:Precorrin-3B methylase [Rhizobium sp.]